MKKITVFVICFLFFISSNLFALSKESLVERIKMAEKLLDDFTTAPDRQIPQELINQAEGIIFMKQYKGGFVLGAKGGNGIILAKDRNTGKWSAPAFVSNVEGSFGFQAGGQSIETIVLIMNKEGLDMLLKSRVKIGVDISAAAGPYGRDAAAQLGAGVGLLIYSRAKGLYAGASIEGGFLAIDEEANQIFYGKDVKVRDILIRRTVKMPEEAKNLIIKLEDYAKTTETTEEE
ncbi:MAG TPA: lipid-binding SYLF domain-containing protein [Candidatus Ratteibacteria bacterium]|nr:lipid-binding SYLF domain-containing protein [Candidatus Ratteibacteria bacterium]